MGCCRSRIVYHIIPVAPPSPVILQLPPITRHIVKQKQNQKKKQKKKQTENKNEQQTQKSLRINIPKKVYTPIRFTFDECDIRTYEKTQGMYTSP